MPFPGSTFKVTANEFPLGPGIIIVLENSLLFEANDRRHVGFDFTTLRLVRLKDINSFDLAYSFQGSVQRISFSTTPKYIKRNEGIERDVTTNPMDWEISFWKLHTVTGAVVARVLVDRARVMSEGMTPMKSDEFEEEIGRAREAISKLPSQEERTTNLAIRTEVKGLEQTLSDVLLKLTDAWLMGNLSPEQRVKLASLHYFDLARRHELGWSLIDEKSGLEEMSIQDFKDTAEDWFTEELQWCSDIKASVEA
jgi:hypothetical protein